MTQTQLDQHFMEIIMSQAENKPLSTTSLSISNFNLPSLHLLYDEIVVILKDSENHLSEFNDDASQAPLLLDSVDVLTQLSCIFDLIGLKGGQLLSTAIRLGLQTLYDNGHNNDTALIMDLSEAIMTLDRYVEFVLLHETIEPTLLLPIINKLHNHIHKDAIDATYFSDFGSSSVVIANPEQNYQPLSELNLDIELLTSAYRSGLGVALTQKSGLLTADAQQKLDAMSAACALIASQTSSLFWQAAEAAVTDLKHIIPLNISQKHTLIYLEQQFHHYLPVIDKRFADLVGFACQRDNKQAQKLREQYAINQLESPQRKQLERFLFGPNRAITDTLNDLIQQQINAIKEKADSYARGNTLSASAGQVTSIAESLAELSSTLQLLGLDDAATALGSAATAVTQWHTPTPKDVDHLLLALMLAENAATAMARRHTPGMTHLPMNNQHISLHQLDTSYATLAKESRSMIADIEQTMSDYLSDPNKDTAGFQNTPDMLRQIVGAMRFLQIPAAANLLSQLATHIEQRLADHASIDEQTLARIADVLMAVDYRLDSLENNRPVSKQSLDIALDSLNQLLAA